MNLLDGKKIAAVIREEVKARIDEIAGERRPTLALVRVGDDPASQVYVGTKAKACAACGIESRPNHKSEIHRSEFAQIPACHSRYCFDSFTGVTSTHSHQPLLYENAVVMIEGYYISN